MNGKIVRALDVGYGNVKFVRRHDSMEAKVICDMFPSRSPAATEKLIGAGSLKSRETVVVKVNGKNYEVGHDVGLAQGVNDISSILDKDFIKSDGYMARVLGALHYMFIDMEENHIDMLVVGLPVNNIGKNKEYLIDKLVGKHELPGGRNVEIKDVRVLEQPLGAFYNFMYSPDEPQKFSFNEAKNQRNLVIDPGMYTFDWIYVTNMKSVDVRSGATNRAMSDIITAIAKVIAKERETTEPMVFKILDDAIRKGLVPKVFEPVILDDYISHAQHIIDESVNELVRKIGDGADVDNIFLAGGGARFFLDAIKKKFPRHEITTTNNSVYANVIGFQMVGERIALAEQVQARKSSLTA